MIKVSNLSKNYGNIKAIDGLNFEIKKGEVAVFLGANGAGKSTTIKIVSGYMSASIGSVEIDGVDILEKPIEVKKKMAYLPEVVPLYVDMRVEDYLIFVAGLRKVAIKNQRSYVEDSIKTCQLESVRNRSIKNLSKGFKQRVGIAQAIVSKPEVLLLDEPTSGLDPTQILDFRNLVNRLKGKTTFLISTHVLSEAQAICDKVIIIDKGRIVSETSVNDLDSLSSSKKYILKVMKKSGDLKNKISQISGVKHVSFREDSYAIDFEGDFSIVDDIASLVINEKLGILELKQGASSLERVFIDLVKGVKK